MASKTEIVNMALAQLEVAQSLQSVEEDTPVAIRARSIWDNALESVLVDHEWGFASATDRLALSTAQPVGWKYAYTYPSQCLMVRRVFQFDRNRPDDFDIKRLVNAKTVVCNAEGAYADYTIKVDQTYDYPPYFVKALASRLAAELSMAMQASAERYNAAMQTYMVALSQAVSVDSRESRVTVNHDGDYVKIRR